MEPLVHNNLEWPLLLQRLASHAQTEAGQAHCLALPLNLTRDAIEKRWHEVEPLKELARAGYKAPIGALSRMEPIFRAASLGQILDGESLRAVAHLLATVRGIHRFTSDLKSRCPTLDRFHRAIYPLPQLSQAIEKAIGPDGAILDDASPELMRVRRAKVTLRKRIETQIRQLLVDNELETYIQDKFFTLRAERYVIPIRLDGRGRVKGSIYDTSASGQTLYIEPTVIAPLNEELLELELAEKLEILRIFKELSAHVATEHDILLGNYESLVELDALTAQACLAYDLDGLPVTLTPKPVLKLVGARHPLVKTPNGERAVANDILLKDGQTALVVSGPNAGGKTVVLKTAGLLHLMAKSGLLIPAARETEIHLFNRIFLAMGDTQSITANLSTFSGHLMSLKPILEQATGEDLVLLDELAIGTEPQTGSAIGQAILEKLAGSKVITLATTHFDSLKGLAVTDPRFRNGSMEFSTRNLKPTYNLILDIPGQSYGIEVAEHMGLPAAVIARARELRGQSETRMDGLVESLLKAREDVRSEEEGLKKNRLEMEAQKARWEEERRQLQDLRKEATRKTVERQEETFGDLKQEFYALLDEMKDALKRLRKAGSKDLASLEDDLSFLKNAGMKLVDQSNKELHRLEESFEVQNIPGEPCAFEDLEIGSEVFILSIAQQGLVVNLQKGTPPTVEVQAGLLKIRPAVSELRLIKKKQEAAPGKKSAPQAKSAPGGGRSNQPTKVGMVIPTATNTLDVRGYDAEKALTDMWAFIDRAVMRGETMLVMIHGHGTDTLKKTIRLALAKAPYPLNFRPGEAQEGGDGVTVVSLEH